MKTKFDVSKFRPCSEGADYYATQVDFESGWNNCKRGDWMLWIAKKLQVDDKTLTLAKGKCANTVRHLMKDERLIAAIDASIAYGNGEISREELNNAAYAADAAYAVVYAADAACAVADAAYAAYTACADDAYAADAADSAAYAAADAREENQLQTADICREILTKAVFEKINE